MPAVDHERRADLLCGATVALMAFVVRLGPLVHAKALTARLEYDDGVYYAAAVRLVRGALPYRDVVFVHPPGILLLLSPFTLLARVVGDPTAIGAARVAMCLLGAANAVLVWAVLRRRGPWTAFAGGLLYAAWRLPATTEHTVMLEPVLAFLLLLGMLLLRRGTGADPSRSRVFWSGVALGAGVVVKLWMAPIVVLLAVALLIHRPTTGTTRRAVGATWVAGVGAALLLGLVPFALAAPTAFVRLVFTDQLRRGGDGLGPDRLHRLDTVAGVDGYRPWENRGGNTVITTVVLAVLATCLLVVLLGRGAPARQGPAGTRTWAAILVVQVLMLLAAPVAYYHYLAWAAPAVAVVVSEAVADLVGARALQRRRRRAMSLVGVATVILAGVLAGSAWRADLPAAGSTQALPGWLAPYRCVSSTWASWLVSGDAYSRALDGDCPGLTSRPDSAPLADPLVDPVVTDDYAILLDSRSDVTYDVTTATRDSTVVQSVLLARLQASDAVVLPSFLGEAGLDGTTQPYLLTHFRQVAGNGELTVWARTS